MLAIVEPFALVLVAFFVLKYAFALLHTLVPLAIVLTMGRDFVALALLVSELKLAKITIFLYERFLARLWVLLFLNHHFQTFSMLKVIFKITLIRNTFTIDFLASSLSFSFKKVSKILPYTLALHGMIQHTLTMFYKLFSVSFIVIYHIPIGFGNHHKLAINTFKVDSVF